MILAVAIAHTDKQGNIHLTGTGLFVFILLWAGMVLAIIIAGK